MSTSFPRTLRSLDGDSGPRGLTRGALALVLVLWGGWVLLSRVGLYEVSTAARLEVEAAAHPVSARDGGRVVESRLELGRAVMAGELLARLDDADERAALEEARASLAGKLAHVAALAKEIDAVRESLVAQERADAAAAVEAAARVAESRARSRRLAEELARLETLGDLVSRADLAGARRDAEAGGAGLRALEAGAERLTRDGELRASERRARVAELETERREVEGLAAVDEARIAGLEARLERRRIVAPVAGTLADVASHPPGSVVGASERLATIVPPGTPRVVGLFPVASAGRIEIGQPARVRLDGFPWTRFGSLSATVERVGGEPQEGRLRVELALSPLEPTGVPLRHGLPGSVEVLVDEVSPMELLLRTSGRLLRPRKGSAEPPATAAVITGR